ncbi:MAG: hypothetical protein M1339_02515 [Bacteroidetes bacterium]|nr:hypothetical protein [Bacteroidota bacterium]
MATDASGNTATSSVTIIVSNATTQSAAGLTVYHDSLSSPWMNASYGASVGFSNSTPFTRVIFTRSKP